MSQSGSSLPRGSLVTGRVRGEGVTRTVRSRLRLALFQPDIPQNTGAILRTAACFGIAVDVIEPAGFRLDDRAVRRAGLDYLERAALVRHANWEAFRVALATSSRRLVLFTTRADLTHVDFTFTPADTLLFGRESAGVPEAVHAAAAARVRIPIATGARSLNVAVAAAIGLTEALRQTDGFPTAV